jgi:hypothetical protein
MKFLFEEMKESFGLFFISKTKKIQKKFVCPNGTIAV